MKDSSRSALLLIDVINDFDFPGSAGLVRSALPASRRISRLRTRARKAGLPVIYVNDNFGRWRSDFRQQVDHCEQMGGAAGQIVRLLRPTDDDYFVLKPRHSGFYSTSLDVLLDQLGSRHLILTGFSSEICVLYTANDAYMRGYEISVPWDCVGAETKAGNRRALEQMEKFLKADTRSSRSLKF